MAVQDLECDLIEQLLREDDEVITPIPNIESEPHLLISKVRKHYMDYVIKLLTINYETHQKLVNKNIYLPSAIWRCAKNIEMTAAQACMVAQLYRKNIITVVKDLKNDTKKGKLHKKLYSYLHKAPENDKKTQTQNTFKDDCQCVRNKRKRQHMPSVSPSHAQHSKPLRTYNNYLNSNNNMPPATNLHCSTIDPPISMNMNLTCPLPPVQVPSDGQTINQLKNISPLNNKRMSVESQDSDDLMMQLEKLFQGDTKEDDLFEDVLYDKLDTPLDDHNKTKPTTDNNKMNVPQDSIIENHAAQIKSLDERLANLAGLLVNNDNTQQQKTDNQKTNKRSGLSKWLCEEYYLKQKLHEYLDQIGDSDRRRFEKIKRKLAHYFGDDSDDEGVVSPLDETPQFIISCKERIAPWVAKLLTPYYIRGHICSKVIFKALAKHLIRLIYQCSRYPEEYEVTSFVLDFLKNHKTIRCEADFMEFRIENI